METKDIAAPGIKNKEKVLAFLKLVNAQDFRQAKEYASSNLTFKGVMGTRNGADDYFRDLEKMQLHYDIKKVFVDHDDVCVFYDIKMSGKVIFCCGWYELEHGKIRSIRVVFDPRPLLEDAQ